MTTKTKEEMVLITGNTYPVKEALKALGAKWDAVEKGWRVPAGKAQEAQSLVSGAPRSTRPSGSYRPSRCKQCGAQPSRYVRIYRSGLCGGCYQDEKEEREMGY